MFGGTEARRRDKDRGQVAIEYLGFLPILLLLAVAGAQLGLAAYTAQQAGTAARAAARAAADDNARSTPQQAGRAAMSDWLANDRRTHIDPALFGDEAEATVRVHIPSVVPGWDFGDVVKSATMPVG
ncbi:TadE/TadG family type IV pilus assembly protein [Streptomyces sp. NPDC005407]|uniref:TadE/TadG family type IV pilus assembly protein n=1 Tax=Streptomyces sp. NPDC005407 TaxID=3155340 RepID=UPI0033A224BB